MAGEKRFGTSLFGFKRSDVNSYLEKILREFDDNIKEKEAEISTLKNSNKEIKAKLEELLEKAEQVNEERAKIADVLVRAQEKAEFMLEEARAKANEEKKVLEEMIEKEREKYVDIKKQLKELKCTAADVIKSFEVQVDGLAKEEVYDKAENF